MIYITGDTHNTKDAHNLSSMNMGFCCMEQKTDINVITAAIVLADNYFYNEENLEQLHRDSNVLFNDRLDKIISYKKWFFGHWHSDWGYENYSKSKYVPLYHNGIVLG